MTPEQNFWRQVKDHLPGDTQRIENVAGAGTPDVNGCADGHEYWVELKVNRNKKPIDQSMPNTKDGVMGLLEQSQYPWHNRRVRNGGKVFVLVKNKYALSLFQAYLMKATLHEYRHVVTVPSGMDLDILKSRVLNRISL